MNKIQVNYMCRKCWKIQIYSPEFECKEYLCPHCGKKMEYWGTEEIDENTGKVVKEWSDKYRELDNPIVTSGTSVKMNPVVTCPYCNSTNTKKISLTAKAVNTALFGILGTKRHKQWHCNKCGSEW